MAANPITALTDNAEKELAEAVCLVGFEDELKVCPKKSLY
jgi:hypothetical protein